MEGQWRSEIPEDMRKKMITEMYHELARISGEVDKQKVWGSAAKFELMLWSSSPDRNSYLMKMQRKIMSLKKKPGPGEMQQQPNMMANANNVVTSNAMNVAASGMNNGLNMNMNAANMAATLTPTQRGVKPEQLVAAHTQQAAMREMQRAQNTSQLLADSVLKHQLPNGPTGTTASSTPTVSATGTTTTATTTGNSSQTYVERLKEMKQKYWDDLVIVYREFERMVKQKPANQQQERINTFLVNLKRIIALLQQDPSKVTSSNKNDLDRVEAHIHKQTPIDVSASSSPGETNTSNGMGSLTPAQYRTFKLPEARKQQLTAQHAKLREQQQELIMQQSRAKTPSHQAKLAHQAQRLAQMINKISQQLVQCKLAEEYEQSKNMGMAPTISQPTLAQPTATTTALNNTTTVKPEIATSTTTPAVNGIAATTSAAVAPGLTVLDAASKVDTAAVTATSTKVDESFKSVLPDMTGLGASEKLLTAVAAYEKHKPEVLKRGASRFSRIAVTIGAKLNTSYVTS
ncbi:hypothetical protein JG687_00013373 [Phytophthora cactorum]|uniref:Mediator complex subunit 15 KIX domain-containing protein n=1 Tax=Phytophthora cactorum TaxID=29920 RepID=A0A8T1TZ57_9STRA|nr:hypothetical protein JG687_00013373 [Phytophthora cactorum]